MRVWWKVAMLSWPQNKSADIPICEMSGIFVWSNYCFLSPCTENITLLLKQTHLKKDSFMQNNTSEKHSSIPQLLKLKVSLLKMLTWRTSRSDTWMCNGGFEKQRMEKSFLKRTADKKIGLKLYILPAAYIWRSPVNWVEETCSFICPYTRMASEVKHHYWFLEFPHQLWLWQCLIWIKCFLAHAFMTALIAWMHLSLLLHMRNSI